MLRAIPVTQLWRTDFLERIRPGFALSAALHVGLLTALAYYLAFHPAALAPPEEQEPVIQMFQIPPSPKPQPQVDKTPIFKPKLARPIDDVRTTVQSLSLPPVVDLDRTPPKSTTTEQPPTQQVVVDPVPVYRGGLIYPDRAADAGKSGYVIFSFIIEADGSVGNPQVIEEVPDGYGFAAAAKRAFPKWRFQPQLVDGKPVAKPARIKVVFNLN